jgi:AAA+ superfamily predicted ATPase
MDGEASFAPEQFARAFQGLLDWVPTATLQPDGFAERLRSHFGCDPASLPATSFKPADLDRPNVQLALDVYLAEQGRQSELIGLATPSSHIELTFSLLVARAQPGYRIQPGPVGRTMIALDEGRSLACVSSGMFFISEGDSRLAVLVANQRFPSEGMAVEVMAPSLQDAEVFLHELRGLMRMHNVYRRKLISLSGAQTPMGSKIEVMFHSREPLERDEIVLPDGVLERAERSTIVFDRHASELRERGHHMRRGLLLYGPPGTGKTLTATYLAGALADRTSIVLTGPALSLVRGSCAMARDLQPSMVILEDIDLIAQERTTMGANTTSLLFQLLNEIDGIGTDTDVIFVMTTNRADLLEAALAARPGRVDQAIEFPLPDAGARARLVELFCRDLDADLSRLDVLVAETDGASPAFLRELVRKAALYAAMGGEPAIGQAQFADALRELEEGGKLTRSILGAGDGAAPAATAPASPRRSDCG